MSDQLARERMTRERLQECLLTGADMQEALVNAVTLTDALAYGADERAAGVIEGMGRATRAMCGGCASAAQGSNRVWLHWYNNLSERCHASPIHDAIQAMRREQAKEK